MAWGGGCGRLMQLEAADEVGEGNEELGGDACLWYCCRVMLSLTLTLIFALVRVLILILALAWAWVWVQIQV